MHRSTRRALGGMLVSAGLALSLVLTGCSTGTPAPAGGGDASEGPAADSFVVGYSSPSGGQSVLAANMDAFIAAGEEIYGWEVIGLDAQLDAGKQASDFDQFIAQGVDAIVFMPAGAYETLLPAIKRAKDAGIKVLGVSAVLSPDDDIAPLDANLDSGGMYGGPKVLAELVAERTGGEGNVIGVGLGVPVPFLQVMVQQYQEQLAAQAPDMNWLTTVENRTDDIAGAEQAVAEAITANNGNIQAVMSYNDSSSIGASVALKNAGITDAILVGQNGDTDAVAAIKEGRITATFDVVPWRQSLMAAAMVNALLNGQSVPEWVEVPGEVYTKDNVDTRRTWDAAIKEIRDGTLTCANAGCAPEITKIA